MLVPQHVALPGQRLVALPATEVAAVPILAHRLRVLATENQLERKKKESGQFRIRWKLFQTGLLLPECFSLDPIPRLIIKENRFENDASLPRQFFLFSFWQRLNVGRQSLASNSNSSKEKRSATIFQHLFQHDLVRGEIYDFQDTLLSQHRFFHSVCFRLTKLPPQSSSQSLSFSFSLSLSLSLFFLVAAVSCVQGVSIDLLVICTLVECCCMCWLSIFCTGEHIIYIYIYT